MCACTILRSRMRRSAKIEPSAVFFHDGRYIQIYFTGGYFWWVFLPFDLFFFPPPLCPALRGFARLNNEKQHEQLTIFFFFRRWANLCVSCDLHLRSLSSIRPSLSSSPSALYHAIENFPSLPLVLHDRRHPPLVPRFSFFFYVIEDVLFLLALRFILHRRWWLHARVCMCASVPLDTFRRSLVFFLVSGKGYTESLVTQEERSRPLENSTFLWLLYPTILSLLHPTSFAFFCRSYPLRCFSPSRSSRSNSFNFVHFCFLNYFVSSIRWTHL